MAIVSKTPQVVRGNLHQPRCVGALQYPVVERAPEELRENRNDIETHKTRKTAKPVDCCLPVTNDPADCTLSLGSCRADRINFTENLTEMLYPSGIVSR